jgi:thiamine transport system ATP-binding protein
LTDQPVSVACENVRFRYAPNAAAMHFDCSFQPGRITALLGPSGSGKSTLLSLLAGFEVPEAGRILFGGADLTAAAVTDRPVSMIFQENNLFAHLPVFDNVALGISPALRLNAGEKTQVEQALTSVGLGDFARRKPSELSGGERQRVALARVIVRRKPVLLLDEAFASLGPALRSEMLDLVSSIQRERRMTTVMVTHFPEDARRIAGRTVFLSGGRVIQSGDTDTVLDSEVTDPLIRDYLGLTDAVATGG